MTSYWIIAPYDATQKETWEKIWQFDLANGCISIGWGILGDVSQYDKDQLATAVAQAYPNKSKSTQTQYTNAIWNFFHSITVGDIVIARQGTKRLAAVGIVTKATYFDKQKNSIAINPEDPHFYLLAVDWLESPRNKKFDTATFGLQTVIQSSHSRFQELIEPALYLNGVYEAVLQEIVAAQEEQPDLVCYLQPYKQKRIVYLATTVPSPNKPVCLYLSITTNLGYVTYRAKIVGWEDKEKVSAQRLEGLNKHIQEHQPGEEEIYLVQEGKKYKNLISILSLEKLENPIPVSDLIKTSNGIPYKPRTQSGNWSTVLELPSWRGFPKPFQQLESEFAKEVEAAQDLSSETRLEKLSQAPKIPEKIQVTSTAYRRNPHVVAEVLARAIGKCAKCGKDAPFIRASNGTPYLEVHHWVSLAKGGEDTIENTGALCPNCHREIHYG